VEDRVRRDWVLGATLVASPQQILKIWSCRRL
jgi:hypothetical protein